MTNFSLLSDFNWHDFIAGWLGGVAGLAVGHPADTIKVRQQTYGTTLWPSVRRTYKHEGFTGFFKGMMFPLMTTGPANSIFFGFYGNTLQYLQGSTHTKVKVEDPQWQQKVFLAGCAGGLASVVFTCPIELIKVVLQANTEGKGSWGHGKTLAIKTSMIACIKNVYKQGGFFGFYRGFVPMLWRDVPSYGLYTWAYEASLNYIFYPGVLNDVGRQIFAGGIAGVVSWIFCMPFDVVKSRMQVDALNLRYKGMFDCFRQLYCSHGIFVFNTGLVITCLRAFPVNAAIFLGVSSWITCMPFDLVKTRMQLDNKPDPIYRSMTHCFYKIYKEEGIRIFNKGILATCFRAFPQHATVFVMYELTLNKLYCSEWLRSYQRRCS